MSPSRHGDYDRGISSFGYLCEGVFDGQRDWCLLARLPGPGHTGRGAESLIVAALVICRSYRVKRELAACNYLRARRKCGLFQKPSPPGRLCLFITIVLKHRNSIAELSARAEFLFPLPK